MTPKEILTHTDGSLTNEGLKLRWELAAKAMQGLASCDHTNMQVISDFLFRKKAAEIAYRAVILADHTIRELISIKFEYEEAG